MSEDELRERLERLRQLLNELEDNEENFKQLFRRYLETAPKETRH